MPGATADPAERLQVGVPLQSRAGAGLTEPMKKLANRETAGCHQRRNIMFSNQNHDTDTQQIKIMKPVVLVLAAAVGVTCCLEKGQSVSPGENQATSPPSTAAAGVGPDSGKPAPKLADTLLTLTQDPSLFERNGNSYKDLSYSASAKRAAYYQALFLSRQAQTSSPASCINVDNSFRNSMTAAGYVLDQGGNQGPGQEGWLFHSQGSGNSPTGSSRFRYNVLFNDGSAPHTFVSATMRGAPNDGKNSYVVLREQRCADDPNQTGCDEIDIVEYYGYPPGHRSEWTIYQNSGGEVGNGRYPTTSDPGLSAYTYQVYLEKGNYMNITLLNPSGTRLGYYERHSSQGYVPSQPMYVYAGIWDCSSIDPKHQFCVDGAGSFPGDAFSSLDELVMGNCN
jgi:hypothetical protein